MSVVKIVRFWRAQVMVKCGWPKTLVFLIETLRTCAGYPGHIFLKFADGEFLGKNAWFCELCCASTGNRLRGRQTPLIDKKTDLNLTFANPWLALPAAA